MSMYRFAGKFGCASQSKLYHCLVYHSLDVAATGKLILDQEPERLRGYANLIGVCPTELKYWLILFLGLHDIGKFARSFQSLKQELFQEQFPNQKAIDYVSHHSEMGWYFSSQKEAYSKTIEALRKGFSREPDFEAVDFFLGIFAGHHGEPANPRTNQQATVFSKNFFGVFLEGAIEFIQEWTQLVLLDKGTPLVGDLIEDVEEEPVGRSSWLWAGFGTLSDWLGSDTEFFHYYTHEDGIKLADYWYQVAIPSAEKCLKYRALKRAQIAQPSFQASFPKITIPSPLQTVTQKLELTSGPHLFLLEDVMGAGKTEAALHLAHRMLEHGLARGVFFALPTMATSNAMYHRVRDFIPGVLHQNEDAKPFVILSHSSAGLVLQTGESSSYDRSGKDETATRTYQDWFYDSRKKSLLAQFGVGTIDQALVGILPMKHQCLRLYGLHQKILIVDEVHACDDYIWTLLLELLQAHWKHGGSAILLSATLPLSKREVLFQKFHKTVSEDLPEKVCNKGYPLVTVGRSGYENQELVLEAAPKSVRSVKVAFLHAENEVFAFLRKIHSDGKCAVWIRNTVKDAISAYRKMRTLLGCESVILFHSRFVLGDRLNIEDKVNQTFGKQSDSKIRKGKVLIATQVVEQSMDLDFDEMITDLAPVDYILQRTGRLRRHARTIDGDLGENGTDQRGEVSVHIYGPEFTDDPAENWYSNFFPSASFVYARHGLLWATARALGARMVIQFPQDCRSLIEEVFDGVQIPQNLQKSENQGEGKGAAQKSTARSNAIKFDGGYLGERQFMEDIYTPTRLGADSVQLRLICRMTGKPLYEDSDWRYSDVKFPKHALPEAPAELCQERKEQMQDRCRYSIPTQMSRQDSEQWAGILIGKDGKSVELLYSREIGLWIKEQDHYEF